MSKTKRRKSTVVRRSTGNPRNQYNDGVRAGNDIVRSIKADPDYQGYDATSTRNKQFNIIHDIYLTNTRILYSAIDTNNRPLEQRIRGIQSVLGNFLKTIDSRRYTAVV